VLVLTRAEKKKVMDSLFPFLVQQRMPDTKAQIELINVGPGSYKPDNASSKRSNLNLSNEHKVFMDNSTNQLLTINSSKR
jgi:hypothetical protein